MTIRWSDYLHVKSCLNIHLLNSKYLRDPHTIQKVTDLAATRFSSRAISASNLAPTGIQVGANLVLDDLERGEDPITSKMLSKISLSEKGHARLAIELARALFQCANYNTISHK